LQLTLQRVVLTNHHSEALRAIRDCPCDLPGNKWKNFSTLFPISLPMGVICRIRLKNMALVIAPATCSFMLSEVYFPFPKRKVLPLSAPANSLNCTAYFHLGARK
jgi:hypothetical protein